MEPEIVEVELDGMIFSASCVEGLHQRCDHEACLCDCHLQDEHE